MIRDLKTKDFVDFVSYCSKYDKFKDFYINEGNQKLYLFNKKIAKKVFNSCLKSKNKCFIKFDKDKVCGLAIIYYEESIPFLKLSSNSKKDLIDLLQYVYWHNNNDLYLKCKKYNRFLVYAKEKLEPVYALQKYSFKIIKKENDDVLMKSIYKKREK